MPSKLDSERLIHDIVRLRRAELAGAPDEVGDVRDDLERIVGPTVGRALAARVLGITQTALDRHVQKGAIPVVPTPAGRTEVPLSELVRLALDLEDAKTCRCPPPRARGHPARAQRARPAARQGHRAAA